jgi:hypothetical protein
MCLDAARNDAFGKIAGVVLQGFDASRLQHLDVVVVDRCRFGEHLLGGHRGQEVCPGDPLCPLLPQWSTSRSQVGNELR